MDEAVQASKMALATMLYEALLEASLRTPHTTGIDPKGASTIDGRFDLSVAAYIFLTKTRAYEASR